MLKMNVRKANFLDLNFVTLFKSSTLLNFIKCCFCPSAAPLTVKKKDQYHLQESKLKEIDRVITPHPRARQRLTTKATLRIPHHRLISVLHYHCQCLLSFPCGGGSLSTHESLGNSELSICYSSLALLVGLHYSTQNILVNPRVGQYLCSVLLFALRVKKKKYRCKHV